MLEIRNVLNTKLNKKGFTLAELLVVVAIIAILVAVSIPIFTGKLNEAKKNTDAANMRAAKAAAVTEYLSNSKSKANEYYNAKDGKMVSTISDAKKSGDAGNEGYNQAKQGSVEAKAGVVKVTITDTDPENPEVKAVWVDK